jgi:D-alanine transaminase
MTASSPRASFDSTRVCWLNGEFALERDAQLSIFDRGVLFADGVYEVAAVFDGRLVDADLHLARLDRSLAAIGIAGALGAADWAEVMQELV